MNRQKNFGEICALNTELGENIRNTELPKALAANQKVYEQIFDAYLNPKRLFLCPDTNGAYRAILARELEELSELAEKIKWNIQEIKSLEEE